MTHPCSPQPGLAPRPGSRLAAAFGTVAAAALLAGCLSAAKPTATDRLTP